MLSLFAPFRLQNGASLCHSLLPMIGEKGKLITDGHGGAIFASKACLLRNPYKEVSTKNHTYSYIIATVSMLMAD